MEKTSTEPETAARPKRTAAKSGSSKKQRARDDKSVVLLSGGNPQIAKGHGDEPVQAYIASMPGWKQEVGRRLDAIIVRTVPDVQKAVKWNTPFYGLDGVTWFLGFHCITRYVKVAFPRGSSLDPDAAGSFKAEERALSRHLRE